MEKLGIAKSGWSHCFGRTAFSGKRDADVLPRDVGGGSWDGETVAIWEFRGVFRWTEQGYLMVGRGA
jgi:hypothetical protein